MIFLNKILIGNRQGLVNLLKVTFFFTIVCFLESVLLNESISAFSKKFFFSSIFNTAGTKSSYMLGKFAL